MNILVVNAGSSSIKCELINAKNQKKLSKLSIERLNSENPILKFSGKDFSLTTKGIENAFPEALKIWKSECSEKVDVVAHRVVHGGEYFFEPTLITAEVKQKLLEISPLAPLHNPVNLKGIEICEQFFQDIPQVAVFDTGFHATIPRRARLYAIPKSLTEKYHIRRYGFHGISHQYVAQKAAEFLEAPLKNLRLITCHLGNGCSVTAIEYGCSVETSTGMTPLEGLVMGTRSGDVDFGAIAYIAQKENLSFSEMEKILNYESGLKGLSGIGNDMRDILKAAQDGNEDARMAIQVFSHRLRKYIGAYAAVMGGVDAIVFTGGIGENSPEIRHRVCQRLDFLGAVLNEDLNREQNPSPEKPVILFSEPYSRVKLLSILTDEQLSIALQTYSLMTKNLKLSKKSIPIAVSARHVHLTQETVEKLFGTGYQLTVLRPLSQPGQFAANETVTLVGPRNKIENVRILGPCRHFNQVEISRTDEFYLGIDAPVRESGNVSNSPGITIVGPKGSVTLHEGVICAWRHIHMPPNDALEFGVEDKDLVSVEVNTGEKSLIFNNVLIRVSDKFKLEMHIDTDEANAAEICQGYHGELHLTEAGATLIKRK
jgi:acetate kinase